MESSQAQIDCKGKKKKIEEGQPEKQQRKKTKIAQPPPSQSPLASQSPLSSDDENLTLSQFALLAKKSAAPITPKKKEKALQKGKSVASEAIKPKKAKAHHKRKKLLHHAADIESDTFPVSKDISSAITIVSEDPYNAYQALIGQLSDIKLRIFRWWHGKLYGPESSDSILFLSVDEKGNKLQGSVPPFLAKKWNTNIEENSVYYISSIQIAQSGKHTQLVEAPIQLQATEQTKFELIADDVSHPQPAVQLTKLSILPCIATYQSVLRDILAIVVDIRPPVTRPSKGRTGTTQFAEAFLTDDSIFPKCIVLTLWQEALIKYPIFSSEINAQFLLQATTVKPNTYRGNHGFQTTSFTRMTFPQIHNTDSKQLLERIIASKSHYTTTHTPHQSYSDLLSQKDQPIYTIAEFLQQSRKAPAPNQEFLYTVRASIVHIYSELPTTYRSCIACNKGMVDEARDRYGCPNSRCMNQEGKTTYRYKLKVEIKDQSDRIDITIFNKDAEEILRTPATTIRQMHTEDNGISKIQDLFRKAYNKTFKFTFKVDHSSYEYIQRGSYTLHQIEWVPKALHNPEQLLFQPSQLLTDSLTQSSSSAKQHILLTPSTVQVELAATGSDDKTSSSDHSNASTAITTSSKNTSSNEE